MSSSMESGLPNCYQYVKVPLSLLSKYSHTMGDPGQYHQWSDPQLKLLLQLLVDANNQGFRQSDGKFNKLTIETRILSTLNQELGSSITYSQYRNWIKMLKARYQSLAEFLRCSSGFGWDRETKKFTADDEVWNVYLKAHPDKKYMRDDSFEDYEELKTIYGPNTASGQNDIDFVQQASEREVFSSSSGQSQGEKLPQRKKARTDAYNSNMVDDEPDLWHDKKKRWEKEAEDKANNVWDAIKEIPDLDDDLHYEAMTLVHSLGMKSGLVNMSITDRCGWIKRNLRKPNG
ncbi:unnamed protein product [Thlaspi arvense]|uniref:Myb/SANT-like domain-containing protein n=1 Tax=Thlaspi arvense TaxID=13288 RepID=A0AAU9SB81_THLAR|nr:unnamed protein product [Thlaspi arvense]